MDDTAFDAALVAAAFSLAGERGWDKVTVTQAARTADLPLDRARGRFMGRGSVLARFGRLADQHALAQATNEAGLQRDRLFDLVMRRLDFLQTHREGVLALKTYLPRHPGLTLLLGMATAGSMAWLLEAAGLSTRGVRGSLRVQGMVAVWLAVLRAWEGDGSDDLAATMAALDRALDRAVRAESWLPGNRGDTGADLDAAEIVDPTAEPEVAAPPLSRLDDEPPLPPLPEADIDPS